MTENYNTLVYADNKYYLMDVCDQITLKTSHKFKLVTDPKHRLSNILPKSMYSYNNRHCIVDIDNNIHYVIFDNYESATVHNIYLNIGKTMFSKVKIVKLNVYYHDVDNFGLVEMLLKNLDDRHNKEKSYEYFVYDELLYFEQYFGPSNVQFTPSKYYMLDNTSVAYNNDNYIVIKINNLKQKYLSKGCRVGTYTDGNNKLIEDLHLKRSTLPVAQHGKYYCAITHHCQVITIQLKSISILIDSYDNCYISDCYVSIDSRQRQIGKLNNDSTIFCDNNNRLMILTGNTITGIISYDRTYSIVLPVDIIQQIGSMHFNSIIWNRQCHGLLPNKYKDIIKVFIICNRLMGKFKIPHGVLSIIFSIIVN